MSGPVRVFVVEDDPSMRRALGRLLAAAGYNGLELGSAEELLDADLPAGDLCVITDIHLPAMSGFDLITNLRRRRHHLPVVFITAHDTLDHRNEAKKYRRAVYLAKPFEGTTLLNAIWEVLRS